MAATKTDVITLHGFGPFLGTPDSSPFVIKVMLLLKFAGLPFRTVQGNPLTAPHRLLPTIEDDGVQVADSSLIRRHIENRYHLDFDQALSSEQKAIAWAVERMCEDHLYFAMLDLRWTDSANFNAGLGAHMFGAVPAPVRPLIKALLRRMNAKRLHGHGIGRHARAQIADFAIRDVDALAAILGDKPYLNGDKPCGADAFVFGIITAMLTPQLDSPIRTAMQQHTNLVAYRDRITKQYFSGQSTSICSPVEPVVARHVG
jgi:glutathione S-transferase